ncbi:MAG: geranylgeranyl reductase family protein [Candidatus Hodarchaeota archaeon]
MDFDVVVCGAGSAGCITATMLAKKRKLNVALLDRKSQDNIGRKVCGDAIAEFHFTNVQKELDIPCPTGKELQKIVKGLDLFSPDKQNKMRLIGGDQEGFIIDRHLFGQRLLGYALDAGVNMFDEIQVQDLIVNKAQITGVNVKSKKDKEIKRLEAKIVVDATGSSSVLRKNLTPELASDIELNISKEDVGFAYREIRELKQNLPEDDYLKLYFAEKLAPGGYIWHFPRGEKVTPSVNAGIGIAQSIPPPSPKERFYNYMKTTSLFKDSKLITGGAGLVPMRRPNKSFVTNGLVLVGDAGWQVNPLHAGGLGTTLESGIMAANAIADAINSENITPKGLWNYNVIYNRSIGAKHAPLDIFRLLLRQVSDQDLNIGMMVGLVTDNDLDKISRGLDIELSFIEKVKRGFKGRKILRTLIKIQSATKRMKRIKKLYQDYPDSPENLENWNKKVIELYKGFHPDLNYK